MNTPISSTSHGYVLGDSDPELERLSAQAQLLADHTRILFDRAGLGSGQRVLDIGCGAGDVSLIAAEFVGSSGQVVGIDQSQQAVATANRRARRLGLHNVEFQVADITGPTLNESFDVIVGRIVLMHIADPVRALSELRRLLTPGGLMVLQEGDIRTMGSIPDCPLIERVKSWLLTTLEESGASTDMGARLTSVVHRAGLRPEGCWISQPSSVGDNLEGVLWLANLTRSMMPAILEHGIATADEIQIDTLGARLFAEANDREAIVLLPRLVGVYARG